jgi:hypothetical protein
VYWRTRCCDWIARHQHGCRSSEVAAVKLDGGGAGTIIEPSGARFVAGHPAGFAGASAETAWAPQLAHVRLFPALVRSVPPSQLPRKLPTRVARGVGDEGETMHSATLSMRRDRLPLR